MEKRLVVLLFVACAAPLGAQSGAAPAAADPALQARCQQYVRTPLPAEAYDIVAPNAWPGCNSYKLYSGIGGGVDFSATRHCAWVERLAIKAALEPENTLASAAGGPAMLAVLFANGEGVARDIPLARRFACEAGLGASLGDIEALPAGSGPGQKKFKYCAEVRAPALVSLCTEWNKEIAAWNKEQASDARQNPVDSLTAQWPAAQRDALLALARAADAYSAAHAQGEVDLSRTGHAAAETAAERMLRERFIAAVKACEQGRLPRASAADSQSAQDAMNRIFPRAVAAAGAAKPAHGSVGPDGIRKAQQAWLVYRDAWLNFAKVRYPSSSHDAWVALLTNDRVAILHGTLCEIGAVDVSCDERAQDSGPPRPLP
jgi:uncharacterized protein YecT (DUF1311 family)